VQHGLGPLQTYIDDPDVSEVMVVGGKHIWVEDADGMRHVGALTDNELAISVERIARACGRRLDLLSPILDARLSDGSRACVIISPVAIGGAAITIRKFTRRILPLASFGPATCTDIVRDLVQQKVNVVVAGATSSGKTSLISSVSQSFAPTERIVCVEDTAELRVAHPHFVQLQTRPANSEGVGEISLQSLVRASLRLRPDRLIVGEVRGSEVVDMLLALSSGHRGCWSTVHATSATETIDRLASMVLRDSPQWSHSQAVATIRSAVGAIIFVQRTSARRRSITEIVRCSDSELHTVYRSHDND
jgi:pilus assembly protein CpaF